MLWHSILPSQIRGKDSANRMQRARSMLRCSLFSQIFCKYTPEGVAKLATPPESLTNIIYFSRSSSMSGGVYIVCCPRPFFKITFVMIKIYLLDY